VRRLNFPVVVRKRSASAHELLVATIGSLNERLGEGLLSTDAPVSCGRLSARALVGTSGYNLLNGEARRLGRSPRLYPFERNDPWRNFRPKH
jgi:hypothetical protein